MCDAPPHERNWRLYQLLDLVPSVTTKQVKWTFRKVTLRHHYYQAYLVLYNRHRKCLYDMCGEEAYGFISSGTWGPLVTLLGATGSILFYCVLMMVQIALLIIFFAVVGLRADNKLSWGWDRIAIPMMIFVIVMLLTALFATVVSFISPRTRKEGMTLIDRFSPVGNTIAAVCYFCLPFVLASAVRDDPQQNVGNYIKYMGFPIAGDIVYYITSLIWRWPRRIRMQMEVDNNVPSAFVYWWIFIMAFLNMFCGIVQWVVLGYKLDNRSSFSWYAAVVPFFVRAIVRIVEAFLRSWMKHTIGVRSEVGVAFDTLGSFFTNGLLFTGLYFVAVRLERGPAALRMAHALIPVYLTLAYIFVALIITLVMLLVWRGRREKEERRGNYMWVPPADAAKDPSEMTTASHDGAIQAEYNEKPGEWDALDDATPSSALFPEETPRSDDYRRDYTDDDYDEEEEVFPRDKLDMSARRPYGTQHSYTSEEEEEYEEDEEDDLESEHTDAIRTVNPDEARNMVNDQYTSRPVHRDPVVREDSAEHSVELDPAAPDASYSEEYTEDYTEEYTEETEMTDDGGSSYEDSLSSSASSSTPYDSVSASRH